MVFLFKSWKPVDVMAALLPVAIYVAWFAYDLRTPSNLFNTYVETPISSIITPGVRAPWRYRFLPNIVNWTLSKVKRYVPALDYHASVVWAHCASMAVALVALYALLRSYLNISTLLGGLGVLGAASSYPLVFGYQPSVYMTLSDSMSYGLVTIALMSLFSSKYWLFVVICVAAVLTRETNLILICPLLLDGDAKWLHKLTGIVIPTAVVFGVRIWLGWEIGYLSLGWNRNIATPVLANILYVFLALGVFWAIGVIGWLHFLPRAWTLPRNLKLLWLSMPVVTGALLIANILWAILAENRILFLVFPWIIGIGTAYLSTKNKIGFVLPDLKRFASAGVVTFVILGGVFFWMTNQAQKWFSVPGQMEYILASLCITVIYILWEIFCWGRPQI